MSWEHDSGFNIELTTACALKCPLCARTMFPDQQPATSLSLEVIRQIFPASMIQRQSCFRFIGNHGDPIFHPHLGEVVGYFTKFGAKKILINTSGSGRKVDWWRNLAKHLRPQDVVLFSIDGLEDTNADYRVGSSWDQIHDAVRALSGRVKLGWKFIVFRHNQHQLHQAVQMAKEWGFQWISFEHSNRWGPEQLTKNLETLDLANGFKPRNEFVTDAGAEIPPRWPGNYQLMDRTLIEFGGRE